MKILGTALALCLVGALLASPASGSVTEERAHCELVEAEWGAPEAAYCWERLHEAEALEASEARHEAEAREREAAEAQQQAEHQAKEESREQHRQEREENRIRNANHPRRRPTVRRHLAEEQLAIALHKSRAWKTKKWGSVFCDGGRINRTSWKCGIYFRGRSGSYWCGEAKVSGAWFNPNEGNKPWFRTEWRASHC